jgi:lysylphosphatidylglycerol synthetase-like protein (DUF2156 family)
MKAVHWDIAIGVLALALWLLSFQTWWGQNSELRRHSPERFNRRLGWWLVAALIVIVATVIYHIATHGFKPLWL